MKKQFYNYNSYWYALAGLGLAYVYLKTLGKDKNLSLGKSLLIGGVVGGGIGLGIDLMKNKKEVVVVKKNTEQSLTQLAKSISSDAEAELSNYLFLLNKANLSDAEKEKGYNVLNGFLLAKKDNKWDSKADVQGMKKILLSYGVTEDDFKVFQTILVSSLATAITNIFSRKGNTADLKRTQNNTADSTQDNTVDSTQDNTVDSTQGNTDYLDDNSVNVIHYNR
jgi:hypothetical protein